MEAEKNEERNDEKMRVDIERNTDSEKKADGVHNRHCRKPGSVTSAFGHYVQTEAGAGGKSNDEIYKNLCSGTRDSKESLSWQRAVDSIP